MSDLLVVAILAFLLGVAAGLPWGALWATWRRTPRPMPWTDVGNRPPAASGLPIQPGEQISINELVRRAKMRTIDKQGETEVPADALGTKVGDPLGPDV